MYYVVRRDFYPPPRCGSLIETRALVSGGIMSVVSASGPFASERFHPALRVRSERLDPARYRARLISDRPVAIPGTVTRLELLSA